MIGRTPSPLRSSAGLEAHRPDVTLMDIQMPNVNGIEAISRIRSEFADAKILVLSTYAGDVQILHAIKAGARGSFLKGNVRTELLKAIRTVHAGRKRIPPEIAAELAEHAADDELSLREIDVLRLIGEGNANKQNRRQTLDRRRHPVKNHISNILSKLGANDEGARSYHCPPARGHRARGAQKVALSNPSLNPFDVFRIN